MLACHAHPQPHRRPAAEVGLFLCLALSIDYSFFLLTRFQESRREYPERSAPEHVADMLLGSANSRNPRYS